MALATAPVPGWTHRPRTRIDDSRRGALPGIDLSAIGPYRLAKFRQLVTEWRTETVYSSSVTEKMNHPAFKAIVEMDEWVGQILDEVEKLVQ